ncbi:alpha/beta fold hydrolase [Halomonas smyrnensis]|uniref:alpha/beta fold hydrolase n=1 Tax=Halomonas smyrnensis TaxID=720605 RepID=UPI0002FEE171|nr:alpha/beta hydrolase [Halomonas smyrnensis]
MKHIVTDHVLIDGKRLAYGVHGEGVPVILLHGTPSSSLIWRNVVPRLVGAGYRVHVYDLLGYGLSERPWDPNVDTSISAQVPILEGLMAHWGLATAHLVAHDIGGGIAQRFGIFHPERLHSLTMIDVVSYDSYPSRRTREQMAAGLERLLKVPDADHRAHFREWLLSTVQDKASFSAGALETYLDFISGPLGQASLFQHQVRHYDPKHTSELADRLPELGQLPVKLIWGANDTWQVVDWAHKLHAVIPGSELSIIDDCGHFSPEDQPEKIADLLVAFLGANR